MEVPERRQEPYEAFMIVPEIMEIVIGFGIFQIRLDLTKFSRLESWVTWKFLRGVRNIMKHL